jgi:hypothetical protein
MIEKRQLETGREGGKLFYPVHDLRLGESALARKKVNDEKAMKAGRNDDKMALINAM